MGAVRERAAVLLEQRGWRRVYLWMLSDTLTLCMVLALGTAFGQDVPKPGEPPPSLEKVLSSQYRWDIIKGLDAWDRDLTEAEVQRRREFARANDLRDWLLQYEAHSV